MSMARVEPPAAESFVMERSEIEGSIPERFERVAIAFPDRPAVRDGERVTTYAELALSASAVRSALMRRLGESEAPVALLLDAGAPLFAAILGTLEARRFYAPLDPRLPPARLESIARRLDASAVIVDTSTESLAASLGLSAPVWRVEELLAEKPASGRPHVSPDDLAYVLFTSGSTGEPKGVLQSHRNLLHNFRKLWRILDLSPADRLSLLSSPSFGASVSDIFGALLSGAALCPYALAGDGLRRLPRFLEGAGVTVYHSVPSVFRSFSSTLDGSEHLSALRAVRLGGEPVLASDFDLFKNRFRRGCRFHVTMGATEIHLIRHWSAGHDTPWPGGVPLGYAVDETDVVLLDETGRETPEEGEIAVAARTLAVGYWKDPAATTSAFVPAPGRPGVRMYRTGDRGRLLPDGCLLHAGRRDARLKIRGHRVEIAEVEAALHGLPGIVEVAVEGRSRPDGTRLVAWVARRRENPPDVARLRRALSERVSAAMVPSTFVFVDALPRTPSGKIDRKALPEPGRERPEVSTAYVPARNSVEALASEAFARVLGLDAVGVEDDFFELGGDSLGAVELLAELSSGLGAELSAADFIEQPTPAALAARAGVRTAAPPSLVRLGPEGATPVFLVPGGAGDGEDLFAARRIARLTGGAYSFHALRSGTGPVTSVEALAERCADDLRREARGGPYRLIGDCIGGILAVAIAQALSARGERVALLVLLDTPHPGAGKRLRGWLAAHAPWTDRASRRGRYLWERLRYHAGVLRALPRGRFGYALRMAGVGARGFADPASPGRRAALERRASHVGALLGWKPRPYGGRIHVVESDEFRRRGHGEAWRRLGMPGPVFEVPGDHKGLILENGESVAATLSRWLAESV